MPQLMFLLDEATATIPVALVDVDRSRMNRFRQRLQDERVTVVVTNPDDLAARVGEGLVTLTRERWSSQGEPRRPWMAPPVDRMVERSELDSRLFAALTTPGAAEVGLTTGLAGAGGFGKTTLAAWVCHRSEIRRRYPGGLLWVTVGQDIHGADLAEKINDLILTLCGRRPAISDPDAAGAELGRSWAACLMNGSRCHWSSMTCGMTGSCARFGSVAGPALDWSPPASPAFCPQPGRGSGWTPCPKTRPARSSPMGWPDCRRQRLSSWPR
jgi:hypothetical protein